MQKPISYKMGDFEPGISLSAPIVLFLVRMFNDKIISWFLPETVRNNKAHPKYYELYTATGPIIIGTLGMCIIPLILAYFQVGKHLDLYYLNAACNVLTLFCIKFFSHYRFFNVLSATVGYFLLYSWLDNGFIYSTNISLIHIFLLAAVLVDRKWGWIIIITNLAFLGFIYHQGISQSNFAMLYNTLGSPVYALLMHGVITIFLGGFLFYSLRTSELSRIKIINLRDQKITLLDEAVQERTDQLNSMRQTIAADFHDQTGNMLAAINRQASMLELKLYNHPEMLPLVESIITNSNDLYASSKDFLWNLNHDSDNPLTLFHYLTGHGQNFFNQFDVAFSAEISETNTDLQQLSPFAALNLIYIFKEAMNNIVKHSGADEVTLGMKYASNKVVYTLTDNGKWKTADPDVAHYGLSNMERRSQQSGFGFELNHSENGTLISLSLPLSTYFKQTQAI